MSIVEFVIPSGEFGRMTIQAHDVAGIVIAGGAHGGAQKLKRLLPLIFAHLVHRQAMAHDEEMHIVPGAPVVIIANVEAGGLALGF